MHVMETIQFTDGKVSDRCYEIDTSWENITSVYNVFYGKFPQVMCLNGVERITVNLLDEHGEIIDSITPYELER